jgi:site-specific DNA recombinase
MGERCRRLTGEGVAGSIDNYVNQSVPKGDANSGVVRRVPAGAIETAVIDQVRALLQQPEVIVGTWPAAREAIPDLTENETREALKRLDPLWDELFPGSCLPSFRIDDI